MAKRRKKGWAWPVGSKSAYRRPKDCPEKQIRRAANRKTLQAALVAAAQDYAERGYKARRPHQKPLTDVFARVVPVDCRPEQVEAA